MKKIIVIGAGPSGLATAYEILSRMDDCQVRVLEAENRIGGLAKTIALKDYRMDLGGHRFLVKSKKVTDWWYHFMPPEDKNYVKRMFRRTQKARIYYKNEYISHPICFDRKFRRQIGFVDTAKCMGGFLKSRVKKRSEHTLEDYYVNRFGKTIYKKFLEKYMEKFWGVSPENLSCEQGSMQGEKQLKSEYFLYPKLGAGQMWQEVAEQIKEKGGSIELGVCVDGLAIEENILKKISYKGPDGARICEEADIVISTMPLKHLFSSMTGDVPMTLRTIAKDLEYRDCVIMGLCINWPELGNVTEFPECLIYVQEPEVKLARIQIYNNWSPYLVKKKNQLWLGLEFFCREGDDFWNLSEDDCAKIAVAELKKIGFIESGREVICYHRERVTKAYPAYAGSYDKKDELLSFVDKINNLYSIGRNGVHRSYNMDDAVLNAMQTVDDILAND